MISLSEQHEMEELYTDISIHTDTTDLDAIIGFDWGSPELDEAMSPLVDFAKEIRNEIETASSETVKVLADRLRSLQELRIALNGNIAKGNLINSIKVEPISENEYFVGTDIAHFYPLCIEYGRGDVYPINFKYLHYFTLSGVEVFSKHSKPSKPYPFVAPSFESVVSDVESVFGGCLDNASN